LKNLVDETERLRAEIVALEAVNTTREASVAALKKELKQAEKESQVN
jgi:hypothetical protein